MQIFHLFCIFCNLNSLLFVFKIGHLLNQLVRFLYRTFIPRLSPNDRPLQGQHCNIARLND